MGGAIRRGLGRNQPDRTFLIDVVDNDNENDLSSGQTAAPEAPRPPRKRRNSAVQARGESIDLDDLPPPGHVTPFPPPAPPAPIALPAPSPPFAVSSSSAPMMPPLPLGSGHNAVVDGFLPNILQLAPNPNGSRHQFFTQMLASMELSAHMQQYFLMLWLQEDCD